MFDHFPDGSRVLGGAPFNVAWHLQGLGVAPMFVSRVGTDAEGDEVCAAMDRWAMGPGGLQRDPDHPTGAVQVTLADDQPAYEILPQQAYDFIDSAAIPAGDVSLIYHGSLAARARDSAVALTGLRRQRGAPVFIDINLRAPWWDGERIDGLLRGARWLKLNEEELKQLRGDAGSLEAALQALRKEYGLEWVVLTRGAEGAVLASVDGTQQASARPARMVDTVGAGDAFSAVLIVGIVRGWPMEIMLARAAEFAAAVCGLRGATIEDRDFYRRMTSQWH